MSRNDFEVAGLILLLGLASGCQTLPEPAATSGTPETIEKAETTETPVADLMYELLQGEMSGFRRGPASGIRALLPGFPADGRPRGRLAGDRDRPVDAGAGPRAESRLALAGPGAGKPASIARAGASIYAARGEIPASLEAYKESIEASPLSLELDLLAVSNSLSTPEAQSARLEILQGARENLSEKRARASPCGRHCARRRKDGRGLWRQCAEPLNSSRNGRRRSPWQADILRSMERTEEAVALLREALAEPIQNAQRLRQMMADLLNSLGTAGRGAGTIRKVARIRPGQPALADDARFPGAFGGRTGRMAETHFLALASNLRPLVSGQPQALNRSVSAYFLGLVAEETGEERKAMDYYYQVEERDYFGVDEYYQKARVRIAHLLLNAGTLEQARMHLKVSRGTQPARGKRGATVRRGRGPAVRAEAVRCRVCLAESGP